jgi:hypothetical protein
VFSHEVRVYFEAVPVKSLHRVKNAVWHSVADNNLQIAGVKIIKLVFDIFVLNIAVVEVRPNIKEKVKVQNLIENSWVRGQSIVQLEIA